ERSGGFAGIGIDKTIDSLELKKKETKMLQEMIGSSRFFSLPAGKTMKPHPDRFSYKITIETAGKKHVVEFSQTSVPAGVKDLLRYLIEKTRIKK
ncbi:MAG TPA: protealysin inhibitor emfourin, partial [Bacteroidales bacterium]|nr:protealysin inhibitor emfourin [Bacteroidales bacterium]